MLRVKIIHLQLRLKLNRILQILIILETHNLHHLFQTMRKEYCMRNKECSNSFRKSNPSNYQYHNKIKTQIIYNLIKPITYF